MHVMVCALGPPIQRMFRLTTTYFSGQGNSLYMYKESINTTSQTIYWLEQEKEMNLLQFYC